MAAGRLRRGESFMVKPKDGWLHDDAALTAGDEGIFYSFPVTVRSAAKIPETYRFP